MQGRYAVLVVALLLPPGAMAQTDSVSPVPVGVGAFGAIGVAVEDGMGYGDGSSAARTPAYIVKELIASGYFTSVTPNRFELPQQVRVKISRKPGGSEDAASAAKLLAGAATLFLLPMKQVFDYSIEFAVECRGRPMGEWKYTQTLEQTQFLLADPHSGTPGLIKEAVSEFLRQAAESGKLAAGCV